MDITIGVISVAISIGIGVLLLYYVNKIRKETEAKIRESFRVFTIAVVFWLALPISIVGERLLHETEWEIPLGILADVLRIAAYLTMLMGFYNIYRTFRA